MNTTAITKTLLSIWQGLPDYAAMLGERIHTHALCSCNTPFFTQRVIDKIIELNVKQQTVQNLYHALQQALGKLPAETQAVLRSYYQPYGVAADITTQAKRLGIAERTFYRHLERGQTFLAERLPHIGINFFTWQDLLHQHPWIKETYLLQCPPNPPRKTPHRKAPNR